MATKQAAQELKTEQVVMAVAEEPFRISLKAERVQEPNAAAVGPEAQWATAFEVSLQLSRQQPVTIALTGQGTIITI